MAEGAAPEKKPPVKRDRSCYASLEIAEQINQVREWLIEGYRPGQIRAKCAEQWDLKTRAAESRIAGARQAMLRDLSTIDRHEVAAQMIESATDILKLARETRQLSNAIGALRLQAELLGLNNRRN